MCAGDAALICGHPGLQALDNRFWLGPMGGMHLCWKTWALVAGARLGALSSVYTWAVSDCISLCWRGIAVDTGADDDRPAHIRGSGTALIQRGHPLSPPFGQASRHSSPHSCVAFGRFDPPARRVRLVSPLAGARQRRRGSAQEPLARIALAPRLRADRPSAAAQQAWVRPRKACLSSSEKSWPA